MRVVVQTADFDVATLYAALRDSNAGQTGAIVSFVGTVRDFAPDQPTRSLFLDHYPGMCERQLQTLCESAAQRWRILDCSVVHRVGELAWGEQIVFVGVVSAHRGDAFRACEYIIDALKTRAPFWKRETLASGRAFWVQQQQADAHKTAQWDETSGHAKEQS